MQLIIITLLLRSPQVSVVHGHYLVPTTILKPLHCGKICANKSFGRVGNSHKKNRIQLVLIKIN
jgi:hypothetical protein